MDVNAKEILDLIQPVPKVICNKTKDWVEVHGSILKISEWAKIVREIYLKKTVFLSVIFTIHIYKSNNTLLY